IQILMIQKTYSPPLLKKVGAVSTICQMNFLFLPDITAKAGANIRWFFCLHNTKMKYFKKLSKKKY
ncbi:hypothetical protein, partial [Maribacter sp.]